MIDKVKNAIAEKIRVPADLVRVHKVGAEAVVVIDLSSCQVAEALRLTQPQHRKKLAEAIKDNLNVDLSVAVTFERDLAKVEAWVEGLLEKSYPGYFKSVVATRVGESVVNIWIAPAAMDSDLPAEMREGIVRRIRAALTPAGYDLGECRIVGYERQQPTSLAILRSVKISQPIALSGLCEQLRHAGHRVPSVRWLQNQVDQLRQRGFLCNSSAPQERHSLTYAITSLGLDVLPSQTGRASSDIARALALRNIKW